MIALAAVDQLRAIGKVAPDLLEAVIAYLDNGNAWAADRLVREPGWVLDASVRHGDGKVFAAYLDTAGAHEIAALRLGKKTEQLCAEAARLQRQLDRYAYGPQPVRFSQGRTARLRRRGARLDEGLRPAALRQDSRVRGGHKPSRRLFKRRVPIRPRQSKDVGICPVDPRTRCRQPEGSRTRGCTPSRRVCRALGDHIVVRDLLVEVEDVVPRGTR